MLNGNNFKERKKCVEWREKGISKAPTSVSKEPEGVSAASGHLIATHTHTHTRTHTHGGLEAPAVATTTGRSPCKTLTPDVKWPAATSDAWGAAPVS